LYLIKDYNTYLYLLIFVIRMKSNLIPGASLAVILCLAAANSAFSQQSVAIGDSNPKTNAILYLKGNGNQGLIIPIVATLGNFGEAGMVVYNSTDKKIHYHDGSSWTVVGGGSATTDLIVGNEVAAVGSNGALIVSGSGTTASPLTVSMVSGTSTGQILKWNNTTSKWELGADNTGAVSLNSAQILLGNASNVATPVTISGDATLSNAGVLTLGTGSVNTGKILDGTIGNADIATNAAIAPSKIGQAAASTGQVLKWNGTTWAPAADDSGAAVALNSAQILVGNAANVPTATLVSGDASLSNTGALTIGTGAVNSAKVLDGSITNADIAANAAIATSKLGQSAASAGQVLEWNGTAWAPAADDVGSVLLNSAQILVGNAANVSTPTAVSGDATLSNTGALTIGTGAVNSAKVLDGSISNVDIAANAAIATSKLGQSAAAAGQVLEWNGTAWAPATDDAGSVLLNSAQILVGNAANVPTATTMSGDATLSNTGVLTLGTGAVNSTKILDATIANADVAAAAAIAGSKINPDFGAQPVATTGSLSAGSLSVTGGATFNALTGAGVRMVTTDAAGVLGSQNIPASFMIQNVLPKGDGTGALLASRIFDDGINLGIGTVTPSYNVDIHKTLSSLTDANLRVFNPSNTNLDKSGIRFGVGDFWAVHLNTELNGDWLQLTDNAGTPVHRWGYQSYYPGAGNAYITGTGLDIALMGGFAGIGTLSPDRKLDISDNTWQLLRLNSTTPGAAIELVSSTEDDWMLCTWVDSFVLASTTTSFPTKTDQFYFTNTAFYPWSDNSKQLGGSSNRWTAVYAVNGIIQTSDLRLKERVSKLKYGLKEVMAMRPVSYSWKSDVNSRKVGLIAQEVQQLVPEVVDNGEYLGMNYGELVPVLINAIQEQQKTIESLEQKLKASKQENLTELETLRAEMEQIKKALGLEAKAK
jgi:hypothetical protein